MAAQMTFDLLYRVAEDTYLMAKRAYWQNRSPCGQTFNLDTCMDCKHVEQCEQEYAIRNELEALRQLINRGE